MSDRFYREKPSEADQCEAVILDIVNSIRDGSRVLIPRAEIEALRAASAGWQPISTAPKDGTPILVWLPKKQLRSHVVPATFHPNVSIIGATFAFDIPKDEYPTHWTPMLPAPSTERAVPNAGTEESAPASAEPSAAQVKDSEATK